VLDRLQPKIQFLRELLNRALRPLPEVYEIRQCGFVAGIELRQRNGGRFPARASFGSEVCRRARPHGLLTRPILDTVVLMPPYCVTEEQLRTAVRALEHGIQEAGAWWSASSEYPREES